MGKPTALKATMLTEQVRLAQWGREATVGGNQVVGGGRPGRLCDVKSGDLCGARGGDATAQESEAP